MSPLLFLIGITESRKVFFMKRKMKRSERAAVYEKIKTAIICLLCAGCVYFTYKVVDLQYKPLSTGSSFWNSSNQNAQSTGGDTSAENTLVSFLEYSKPELIMINRGENRGVLNSDKDGYAKTIDFINKAMQSTHSSAASVSRVSREAVWKGLLRSNSIYVRFPCARPTAFSAQFFRAKDSAFARNAETYSQALLVPDSTSGKVCVFIPPDDGDDEILKITTENFAETLSEIINSLEYIDKKEYAYACELNLDKTANSDGAVLDPMLVIPLDKIYSKTVKADVPWEYKQGMSFTQTTEFTMRLLNVFQYNPNTIRQYADKDGALMFVSGKGTIGVHPDGMIEYKALDETEGLALTASGQNKADDFYAPVSELMDILNKITEGCGAKGESTAGELKFSEIPLQKGDSREMKVCFDYFVDGVRVQLPDGYAVEAVIKNGTLMQLKVWIKTFEKTDNDYEDRAVVDAIDEYCAAVQSVKRISRAELQYKFAEDGAEINADWNIKGE